MTDFGRRTGVGDMLKSTYDPNEDGVIAVAQTEADMKKSVYDANDDGVVDAAPAHKATHQDAGADEVNATGLTGRINYVDQGDATGIHFSTGDFTTDGNWNDLSLAARIPAGAVAAHLSLNIRDATVNIAAQFRENGNSNTYNVFFQRTQVANISIVSEFICAVDADRKVEYNFTNTTWDYISLQVRGYFI